MPRPRHAPHEDRHRATSWGAQSDPVERLLRSVRQLHGDDAGSNAAAGDDHAHDPALAHEGTIRGTPQNSLKPATTWRSSTARSWPSGDPVHATSRDDRSTVGRHVAERRQTGWPTPSPPSCASGKDRQSDARSSIRSPGATRIAEHGIDISQQFPTRDYETVAAFIEELRVSAAWETQPSVRAVRAGS
jgi:hypothetical protein